MCELLGMSANVPTDIRFSFAGFARRGGDVGPHADGWGVAFYDGRAARTFHDPTPCSGSDLARFVRDCPIRSLTVVAHVRRANRGRVGLANTHPFVRELWGRTWVFAHNGQLRGVKRRELVRFRPVGTTDSEHAFCWLLDRIAARWSAAPNGRDLDRAIEALLAELGTLGVFNALLSDGRSLFAHSGRRLAFVTRRSPFGIATLLDEDLAVDFSRETGPADIVTVVATRPLTRDETWTDIPPGRTVILRDGLPVEPAPRRRPSTREPAESRPGRRAPTAIAP